MLYVCASERTGVYVCVCVCVAQCEMECVSIQFPPFSGAVKGWGLVVRNCLFFFVLRCQNLKKKINYRTSLVVLNICAYNTGIYVQFGSGA